MNQRLRDISELYTHLRACADKYEAVAAVNRLETVSAKSGEAKRIRQDAHEWDTVASILRRLARDLEDRATHRHEVQDAHENGTRKTFASLMAEAFPHRVVSTRSAA